MSENTKTVTASKSRKFKKSNQDLVKNYNRIELKRAFSQKTMQLSIIIGMLISLWHFIQWPLLRYQPISRLDMGYPSYPLSAFEFCLSNDAASLQQSLYFFLLPFLAALPYGGSLFADNISGYSKNIYIRVEQRDMLWARHRAVFLSGAVAVALPLLLDFLLTGCALPLIIPDVSTYRNSMKPGNMWGTLLFSYPMIYTLLYLMLDFVFGGLYALLAMYAGTVFSNRFAVLLTPLLFQLAAGYVAQLFSAPGWIPEQFLAMSQIYPTSFWKVGCIALMMVAIIWGLHERSCRNENIL